MTVLLLIRHGQTDWNRDGRYQGQSDIPLNETGRTEARELAARIVRDGTRPETIYTSDLARARETAQILAEAWKVRVHEDARLREIDQGVWEGMRVDEIQARFPSEFQTYLKDPLRAGPPQGETVGQVQARVREAVDEILTQHPGGTAAVVSHGLALGLIRTRAAGRPLEQVWDLIPANADVEIVELEAKVQAE